tara:strand:- start:97 stop:201 length:105 start_codon:yes stop_codon:yes gene_type:complete
METKKLTRPITDEILQAFIKSADYPFDSHETDKI